MTLQNCLGDQLWFINFIRFIKGTAPPTTNQTHWDKPCYTPFPQKLNNKNQIPKDDVRKKSKALYNPPSILLLGSFPILSCNTQPFSTSHHFFSVENSRGGELETENCAKALHLQDKRQQFHFDNKRHLPGPVDTEVFAGEAKKGWL